MDSRPGRLILVGINILLYTIQDCIADNESSDNTKTPVRGIIRSECKYDSEVQKWELSLEGKTANLVYFKFIDFDIRCEYATLEIISSTDAWQRKEYCNSMPLDLVLPSIKIEFATLPGSNTSTCGRGIVAKYFYGEINAIIPPSLYVGSKTHFLARLSDVPFTTNMTCTWKIDGIKYSFEFTEEQFSPLIEHTFSKSGLFICILSCESMFTPITLESIVKVHEQLKLNSNLSSDSINYCDTTNPCTITIQHMDKSTTYKLFLHKLQTATMLEPDVNLLQSSTQLIVPIETLLPGLYGVITLLQNNVSSNTAETKLELATELTSLQVFVSKVVAIKQDFDVIVRLERGAPANISAQLKDSSSVVTSVANQVCVTEAQCKRITMKLKAQEPGMFFVSVEASNHVNKLNKRSESFECAATVHHVYVTSQHGERDKIVLLVLYKVDKGVYDVLIEINGKPEYNFHDNDVIMWNDVKRVYDDVLPPFDASEYRLVFREHKFDDSGIYRVRAQVSDSKYKRTLSHETDVVATNVKTCNMELRIRDGRDDVIKALQVMSLTIGVDMEFKCSEDNVRVEYKWSIFKWSTIDAPPEPISKLNLSISLNTSEVTFPRLPPSTYLISLKATVVSKNNTLLLTKEDFTRVIMIESKLQAAVCGGNNIQISYNTTELVLDGSCSVSHGSEVKYNWNCARHRQNLPRDQNIGQHTNADSCFSWMPLQFGNASMAKLDTSLFQVYSNYYVRMFTSSRGYQTDHVDVVINVLARNSPAMDVRCLMNCGKYTQRHLPLILEIQCATCHRYTWLVASCSSNKYCKLTSDEMKQIPPESNYTVTATGFDQHDQNASTSFMRSMHMAPRPVACVVLPPSGVSLQTKFNISCVGSDHAFYKFLLTHKGHTTLLQYGYQPSMTSVFLPQNSVVKVQSCDVDGVCGDDITVKMEVSANSSPDVNDIINEAMTSSTSGNIQQIAQLLPALSTSSKITENLKNIVLLSISSTKFTSPYITRQIADIVSMASKDNSKSRTVVLNLLNQLKSWNTEHKHSVNQAIIASSLTSLSNIIQLGGYNNDVMSLADDFTNQMLRTVVPKEHLTNVHTESFEAFVTRYDNDDEMNLKTENSQVVVSRDYNNDDVHNLKVIRFNSSNVNFSTESFNVDDVIFVDVSSGWEGQRKLVRPVQFSLKNSLKGSRITRIKLNSSNDECATPCEPKVEGHIQISLNKVKSDFINIKISSDDIAYASRVVMTLLEVKPMTPNKVLQRKIVDVSNKTSLHNYVWSVGLVELNTRYDIFNVTIEVYMTSQGSVTMDVMTYGTHCLVWTNNDWSYQGCRVVPTLDSGWTKCDCDVTATSRNSLRSSASVFATQFIVYPNKIDFDEVSWNLPAEFRENPIVMTTTAVFYAFFIALLIWARKRDKEDFGKLPYYEVEDNNPAYQYRYLVVIYNGSRHGAGTTATVVMTIVGNHGSSQGHIIQDKDGERLLTQGSVVNFLVTTPSCLGDIVAIRLWHNNAGRSPEWFLDRLMVWDLETDTCWFVIASRWLAEETAIDVLLHIATAKELHTFRSLFTIKCDSYLRERHLWYSLIGMRQWSCYEMSRCQRVGCCALTISILMLTSLMFYGVANNGGPQLDLGYYSFRWSHVGVGLESAILCFPVTYVVTSLFRLSRDKDFRKRGSRIKQPKAKSFSRNFNTIGSKISSHKVVNHRKSKPKHRKIKSTQAFVPSGRYPTSSRSSSMTPLHQYDRVEMMTIVDVNPNSVDFKPLPWWGAFIGWILVSGITSGCSVLSIMYGMTYGRATSREWMVSLLSGFLEEILFLEPFQALLLSYFIVINNPRHDLRDWIPPIHCKVEPRIRKHPNRHSRQILHERSSNPAYKPPDVVSVKEALEMRAQLRRARRRIKNLFFHAIFLVLLAIVAFGQYDHSQSRYSRTLHNMMDKQFLKIKNREQIYDWLLGPMIDSLFDGYAHYFTDGQLVMVTPPSLRQQRIKSAHSCPQQDTVQSFYNSKIKCEAPLSAVNMETEDFGDSWENNIASYREEESLWKYQFNAIALGALPLVGEHGTYSNDGYVMHLPQNKSVAVDFVKQVKSKKWIDGLTRLVVVEAVLYNTAVRLFCVLQMAIETPNMGVVHLTSHMHIMRAHHVITSMDFVVYISLFLALAMVLYFSVNIVRNAHEEGLSYCANFWNLLEIFTLVTSVSSAAIFLTKASVTDLAFEAYLRHLPSCLSLFQVAASLHYSLVCLLAYTLFFTTLRTVAIMEGHPMFFIVGSTIKRSIRDLGGHAVFLLITYIAFCHMGVIMFRDTLDFSNVLRTMLTVFSFAAEAYGVSVILTSHPFYSGCYLFMFFFIYVKCLINFAAVILENAFRESKILSRDLTREDVFSLGRKQMRSLFAVKREKLMDLGEGENPYEEVLKVPEHLARRRVSRTDDK